MALQADPCSPLRTPQTTPTHDRDPAQGLTQRLDVGEALQALLAAGQEQAALEWVTGLQQEHQVGLISYCFGKNYRRIIKPMAGHVHAVMRSGTPGQSLLDPTPKPSTPYKHAGH